MILTTFQSIYKAYVDLQFDLPWKTIKDILLVHHDVENKTDVNLYNLVEFKTIDDSTVELGRRYHYVDGVKQDTYDVIPNTVRRSKNNVVGIHGIILDVDEFMTIDQTIELLDGLEYVLYTTFRHTMDKHKFRVVIPFSTALLEQDIAGRQQSIIDTFPGVDNASFTVSQSFYFHSGKNDSIAFHNVGTIINPYDFKIIEPVEHVYNTDYTNSDIPIELVDELLGHIYRNVGSLKGQYDLWRTIAWSVCHSVGIQNAHNLMMKYWATKTTKEIKTLSSWKHRADSPTIGTLYKLSNISKQDIYMLQAKYNMIKDRILSPEEFKYRYKKKYQ